jgi:hypothetical protein
MALKYATNTSLSAITALPSAVPTDNLILISTQTASNSSTISFTTGLDSTYDCYEFKFINIKPATDDSKFQFNFSTDSGSNYNVTKTTTWFYTYHDEADTATALSYGTADDLAQSTSFQSLATALGNGADENCSGSLQVFNPSSTTYVKHFLSRFSIYNEGSYAGDQFGAGYGNTTSAINAIQFKMASGNITDGIIKLYGVKKS